VTIKLNPESQYRLDHPERLRIYDIATDNFRDATQDDLDNLTQFATTMAIARIELRRIAKQYLEMEYKGGPF
jgi:hypothetical protein